MFDCQVGGPDAAATLSLVSAAHRLVRHQECKLVELAAHWSDLNHPESQAPAEKTLPGAEQGRQLGGDGTPEVLEFAAAEFGAQMETSYGSARALMADALDLRHRLPELWQLICAGEVPSWRARKVAQATRHLSRSAAMQVDAAVARAITGLPWARFETLLAAKIIEADPKGSRRTGQDLGGRTIRPRQPHQPKRAETVDRQSQRRRCDVVYGNREPARGDPPAARRHGISRRTPLQSDRNPGPTRPGLAAAVGFPERTASGR
jgi:hypothetical protein